jgi:hypothetical protein
MIIVTHMNTFHTGETCPPFLGFRNTNETATRDRIQLLAIICYKFNYASSLITG